MAVSLCAWSHSHGRVGAGGALPQLPAAELCQVCAPCPWDTREEGGGANEDNTHGINRSR